MPGSSLPVLLIDIGNSNTEFASFYKGKIGKTSRIETAKFEKTWLPFEQYSRIIVSSVVPKLDAKLATLSTVTFITANTIPELKVNLPKPSQVGADRLVNALGAWKICHSSCVIIDSGTATTFCYVDAKGIYQGGAIFPGLGIASKALNDYTAKIPLIHVTARQECLGKTTQKAVQSGLYWGFIHMINGMIGQYKQQDPKAKIIGTGQGLQVLKSQLYLDIFEPKLIFKGLAQCV